MLPLLSTCPKLVRPASASVDRREGKAPMTIVVVMVVCALVLCASTVRSK